VKAYKQSSSAIYTPGRSVLLRKLSCDMCGMTPRDVFPRKSGVKIGFLPGRVRRPRRGVRATAVLQRVKSSISGGRLLESGTAEPPDMAQVGVSKLRSSQRCSILLSEGGNLEDTGPSAIVNSPRGCASPCTHVTARQPRIAFDWCYLSV
jgi:hypothetical protein